MDIIITRRDEWRHPLTIDDISKPLGECVEGLFKHLGFTTASYCLLHNGTLCEYERSPEAIGLADGVELELSDEWPQWHWRAHAPSAGPPTSAVFSPLLSAGGGWSFAALVATVCTAWRDEVRAWRSEVSALSGIEPCDGLLRLIASSCPRLRRVEFDGLDRARAVLPALAMMGEACTRIEEVVIEVPSSTADTAVQLRGGPSACEVLTTILSYFTSSLKLVWLLEQHRPTSRAAPSSAGGAAAAAAAENATQGSTEARVGDDVEASPQEPPPPEWPCGGEIPEMVDLHLLHSHSSRLQTLNLQGLDVDTPGLLALTNRLSMLRELGLAGASRVTDEAIGSLCTSCLLLSSLTLRDCTGLTDETFVHIGTLRARALKRLCIAGCSGLTAEGINSNLLPDGHDGVWGEIIGLPGHSDSMSAAELAQKSTRHPLQLSEPCIVGRSRSAKIRMGHTAAMPYVSSRHLRMLPVLVWSDGAPAAPSLCRFDQIKFEMWVEDTSSNGTFLKRAETPTTPPGGRGLGDASGWETESASAPSQVARRPNGQALRARLEKKGGDGPEILPRTPRLTRVNVGDELRLGMMRGMPGLRVARASCD